MDANKAQALIAIEALKARYFRSFDTKDWPTLGTVLADDVDVDETALGGDHVTGATNYVSLLKHDYDKTVTVHHGHMPEIELTAPDTATGTWAVQVLTVRPDGKRLLAFGHDHDTYTLRNGQWLITSTKATRLHLDKS